MRIRWHEEVFRQQQFRPRSQQRNEYSMVVAEESRDLCVVSAEVTLKKKASPGNRKKFIFGRSRPVRPKSEAVNGNAQ
jgi:hypothetical protein